MFLFSLCVFPSIYELNCQNVTGKVKKKKNEEWKSFSMIHEFKKTKKNLIHYLDKSNFAPKMFQQQSISLLK